MEPSPNARKWRTVLQVVVSVCVAVPAAVVLLPISAAVAVWAVGIAGATVIVVSAVQNGLEGRGTIGTLGEGK